MKPTPLVVAALIVAGGCSTATADRPGPPASITPTSNGVLVRLGDDAAATATIAAPAERLWAALPAVYAGLGIPAGVIDAGERTYGTRDFTRAGIAGRRTESYLRCANQGTGALRIRLSILSTVRPAGSAGRAELATAVEGQATQVDGASSAPVRCASTGELEKRIRAQLEQQLRG